MPRPEKDESKEDFIARAIRHFISAEKLPRKEAVGRAYGFWKSYKKDVNKRKK